jgi:DMSO/TMAO reductase YedYZ heme-binding membrane subunit
MTHDPTPWLVARSSGLLAYGLLTATVLAGLVLKGRPLGNSVRPATVMELHRVLPLLALGAIAIHGAALVLDRVVEIPLSALVIPGASPYLPVWTGFGVVAAEISALLVVSFAVRRRIGTKVWRRLHYASYLAFGLATAHGVLAGTDTGQSWVRFMYAGSIGLVVAATVWRILGKPRRATSGSARTVVDRPAVYSGSR